MAKKPKIEIVPEEEIEPVSPERSETKERIEEINERIEELKEEIPERMKQATEAEEAEAARRAARDAELFGDLDEELEEETLPSVQAERDALLADKTRLAGRVAEFQTEVLTLTKKLGTQKQEADATLARTKREVDEQKELALQKFMKDFLPILDDMELGINAVSKADRAADPKLDAIVTGFEKILGQKLTDVFNKFGVKAIDPKGEDFDPNKHEAVSMQQDPNVESQTIVAVSRKGYELNGRTIRPAQVVVNM